jgi:hypothetical protein
MKQYVSLDAVNNVAELYMRVVDGVNALRKRTNRSDLCSNSDICIKFVTKEEKLYIELMHRHDKEKE